MSINTTKCRECGSTAVQEYRPGRWICLYCDSPFTVTAVASETAGGCAVVSCGVPSVGLCLTCQRPFCATHQATKSDSDGRIYSRFVDLCAPCQTAAAQQSAQDARTYQQQLQDGIAAIRDPTEQLIVAIDQLCGANGWKNMFEARGEPEEKVLEEFLREKLGTSPTQLDINSPWDQQVIIAWFLERVRSANLKPNGTVSFRTETWWSEYGFHVGTRERKWKVSPPEAVWRFPNGMTSRRLGEYDYKYGEAILFPNGKLVDGGFDHDPYAYGPLPAWPEERRASKLGIGGLKGMAKVLGLTLPVSGNSPNKSGCSVRLERIGDSKIRVCVALKDSRFITLSEAVDLVDKTPTVVADGLTEFEASRLVRDLEVAGATAVAERPDP